MTGFWGTRLVNDTRLAADVMLAIGTRFKEADSSSWYRGFTFNIPPTADPHRHRAERDRPYLPHRDRRGRRRAPLAAEPGARELYPGGLDRRDIAERIAPPPGSPPTTGPWPPATPSR